MLRSLGITAGACALVAGAALAGNAATTPPPAPTTVVAADAGATGLEAELVAGTASTDLTARRDLLCARVPNAILRTQNLERRLAGDASTKGSLVWLQAQVDKAEAAGRTRAVTVLKNRLAFRTQLATFLPQRLSLLQKAQTTVCAPGAGTAATS